MKKVVKSVLAALLVAGCASKKSADAYGNFESVETIVSSEVNGRLIALPIVEGQLLSKGQYVAAIDSTVPALQKRELLARRKAVLSKIAGADAQIAVVRQQLENLQIDLRRVQNMLKDDAATQKQLDDLTGSEKVLQRQLVAAQAQRRAIVSELDAVDANLALLNEQLNRCRILNPIDGVVLEKYSEVHEVTAAGKPLYKIANLDTVVLRIYVSGGQLAALKIGQRCSVRIDNGKEELEYPGIVTWISDTAEFTPKIIQTREERVNLVYAVKVLVKNEEGVIKIGMPGEVVFTS
jgi:HlyD family secretion protein